MNLLSPETKSLQDDTIPTRMVYSQIGKEPATLADQAHQTMP
jgi:hypothetical protein